MLLSLILVALTMTGEKIPPVQDEANEFLSMYNTMYQKLTTVSSNAQWKASTDVKEQHTGERIGAEQALAAFEGSSYVIEKCRILLKNKDQLDELSVRQLQKVLLLAAHYPGTIPDVVAERVSSEAKQSAILDGFRFCDEFRGDSCVKVTTPNNIEEVLSTLVDLAERKHAWEVSKQTGPRQRKPRRFREF